MENNENNGRQQNNGGHYHKRHHHNRRHNKNFGNKPKQENLNNQAPAEEAVTPAEPVVNAVSEAVGADTFDYEPAPIAEEEAKTVEVVGIKFRNGSKIYYFAPNGISFRKGEHAIVETVRGVEYGNIAQGNKMVGESEVVFPLKPVLRKATLEDDQRNTENRKLEESAKPIWQEKVKKNGLDMQLVDVEYTHDNAKLSFYFTADGRVDFRELVKDLAGVFRTRIELRQIGVRDEAKLFGGLGSCGRPFCCNTFLPDFAQVSIKMAKEQNLSLSSTKISGACGRLMCCLRFEQDTYEREYATFPKVDTIVETPKGRGVIVESSFLTGKIKVKMNNDQTLKTFVKSELKCLGMIKVKEEVSEDLKKLEDK
ncbi:MAG: stage 0 sporulation family protein [Clostridia bacterium]|nr:stage 0 sporulation family protein [Clostridia bacterium]